MGEISLTFWESFAARRWTVLSDSESAEPFSLIARIVDLSKLGPYGTPTTAHFVRDILRGSVRLVWCPA